MEMKRYLLLSLLAVILFGCSPVYQTNYTYTPPKSSSGHTCILQCENNKLHCEQLEELRYQNCENKAESEYRDCEHDKVYGYDKKGRWSCVEDCYCWRSSCERNAERCDAQYRICYQTCGGKVKAHTVCVANCEQEK